MAKIRKPKMKKMPRKPKHTASNEVKARYLERCRNIKKENAARLAAYNAALKKRTALDKMIYS
jgi:hypothetical protein